MKKEFLHLVLLTVLLLAGIDARADLYSYTKSYTDATTKETYRLCLDEKKALWRGFTSNDMAGEVYTVPATVEVDGITYDVVEMDYYYGYSQSQTKTINVSEGIVRMNGSALSPFDNAKEVNLPTTLTTVARYAFGGLTDAVLNFPGAPVVFEGQLVSSGKVYIRVTAENFEQWIKTDYAEDNCIAVFSDRDGALDLTGTTYHTGNIDSGELGYAAIANQLPKVITYSMINKLVVDGGSMNEDDWYQIRQMRNLVSLDLSAVEVEEIPAGALKNCWQLNEVILPKTTTTIKSQAFHNCGFNGPLMPEASITVPLTVTKVLGGDNFSYCRFLKKLEMAPYAITSLPGSFANQCPKLQVMTLPSVLETLGSSTFAYCDIRKVYIPGTLKTISASTFYSNQNLKELAFDAQGVTSRIEGDAFYNCRSLMGEQVGDGYVLRMPASMRYIGNYSFYNNIALTDIEFNEGLNELYYNTFANCTSLTNITLPSSLKYATYTPFQGCSNLQSITCRSILPPTVKNDIITYTARNIELRVPMWSFQEYMTTPGWLEFQDHMVIDETIRPENVYINKEFEYLLKEDSPMGQEFANYHPNIYLQQSEDRIDDGFGHEKYERGNLTISKNAFIDASHFEMTFSPYAKYYADQSWWYYSNTPYNYDWAKTQYSPNSLITRPHHLDVKSTNMHAAEQQYTLQLMNDRWQFVTFPMPVKVTDIQPVDANTQWVIREYDGEARAKALFDQEWKDIAHAAPSETKEQEPEVDLGQGDTISAGNNWEAQILLPGKGYAMKCYNNDYSTSTPVEFTFVPVQQSNQDVFYHMNFEKTLDSFGCEENSGAADSDKGWSLIGNPYPCYFDTRYIDTDMLFLVWDSYNRNYKAMSTEDDAYVLNPGESFFVQIPRIEDDTFAGSITFLEAGRQTYRNANDLEVSGPVQVKRRSSALTGGNPNRKVFNISITNGTNTDQTRVVLNDKATTQYEAGCDINKMQSSEAAVEIWTVNNKVRYAINERPMLAGLVPMSVSCAQAGTYTIQLTGNNNASCDVYIQDKEMNTTTQITNEMGYTFTTDKAGAVEGRFVIAFQPTSATGVEAVEAETTGSGETFNAAGQRVNAHAKGIIIKDGRKSLNK